MSWSPDGIYIAYTTRHFLGTGDVWLYNLITGENKRLTDMPTTKHVSPAWNSDGSMLAWLTRARSPGGGLGSGTFAEPVIIENPIGRQGLTATDIHFITPEVNATFHGDSLSWYDDDSHPSNRRGSLPG